MSIHFSTDQNTVDTIYRIILSVNQLSVYGAVAALCEEYESHQDSTGQPVILVGQSIVLGEIKAEVPVHDEEPRDDQIILQQYVQQVESLSPENKLSKFCKETGFMRVVEVGQYFVTRDAGEFQQTVACREYTLPRDDKASQPKGWIRGNMRIGPVLEVTTSFQHFKYGIEIRIKSMNQDNSHSWVRISYGTVKYVNDSIEDNTENPADSQEEESVQTSSSVVAARSKAKAKPQPRESTGATTIPLRERIWIDIEPSKQDLESYNLSKKVVNLLRHNQKLHREEDGAIQFYKIKFHLRDHDPQKQNWSDDRWIACLAAGGGSKRRYQYCSDYLGSIIYLRALQGHSGRNPIDPSLHDNVSIPDNFFGYIYPIGFAINLHSITYSGSKPGGQNLGRERQTVFFTAVNTMDKDHKDPYEIDLGAPHLAWYKQKKWKKHQNAVYWVDIKLAQRKGFKFYQIRSNAIKLFDTLPAYCTPKAIMMETGENHKPEGFCVTSHLGFFQRFPSKIIGRKNWIQKLLKAARTHNKSNQNQKPNYQERRDPWVSNRSARRSKKISLFDHEDIKHSTRTERPVCGSESTQSCVSMPTKIEEQDQTATVRPVLVDQIEEYKIDFREPGLSHAIVKEAENFRVQELVKKIESHPHREALQADFAAE